MTFKAARARNQSVFMNTNQFARNAVYLPAAGGPSLQLVVFPLPVQGRHDEQNQQSSQLDTLTVRMGLEPHQTARGLQIGGVPAPRERDRIRMEGDEEPYVFVAVTSRSDDTQVVQFQRPRIDRLGNGNFTK